MNIHRVHRNDIERRAYDVALKEANKHHDPTKWFEVMGKTFQQTLAEFRTLHQEVVV